MIGLRSGRGRVPLSSADALARKSISLMATASAFNVASAGKLDGSVCARRLIAIRQPTRLQSVSAGKQIRLFATASADPPPAAHDRNLTEKGWLDRQCVIPRHVSGVVDTLAVEVEAM